MVSLSEVTFPWPGEGFVLSIKSFDVRRGERFLLIGPSGSRKSALLSLRVLNHELTTMSSARRDRFRAEHVGVIFQIFNLLSYGSVLDNVLLPLSFAPKRRKRADGKGLKFVEARRLLESLGLTEDLFDGPSAVLSVGHQQTVAAARTLIGAPEIIIADEPTSALNNKAQDRFVDLLFEQLRDAHATLVMVSHDERLSLKFDRVCHLSRLISADQML